MRQRRFALLAVTALLAALLSPVLVAGPAQAAQVTGTMEKSYINYWGPAWVDATISDDFTVGVYYEETLYLPTVRPLTFYDSNDARASIPAGLTVVFPGGGDYNGTGEVILKGTPTAASASTKIVLAFNGYPGDEMWLTFDPIVIKGAPTTTSISTDTFSPYTGVNLGATVSPATAGGTVEFFFDVTSVGTSPVVAGVASYTGAVPTAFVGSSPVVTAVYSGDATNAGSTSASNPPVFIWGSRVFGGTFTQNGVGLANKAISLLDSTITYTGMVATTNSAGEYSFDVGTPTTLAQAQAGYVIESVDGFYLYSVAGGVKQPNVTFLGNATVVTQSTWGVPLNIYINAPPTWIDQTLAQPRLGETYSDAVVASTTGTPTTLVYTVTGDLPSWMTFTAGSLTGGVPTDQNAHTFTVQVDSTYGTRTKAFTLTAADAWIPPSFTDSTVATAQAGVTLDDEVLATGDGSISYAVTGGALPAWLTLGADGSISGTPPLSAAGDPYSFTVTAAGHGTATVLVAGVVAAAPTVGLDLNFVVGDVAVGSAFDFEVTGAGDAVPYSVTINSVPYLAASGFTSALGAASGTATVQSAIGAGSHSIVLTTLASDGTPRTVTVWFTVLASGTIGAISLTGPIAFIDLTALASTGSSVMAPLAAGFALLLGAAFIRRRRALEQS